MDRMAARHRNKRGPRRVSDPDAPPPTHRPDLPRAGRARRAPGHRRRLAAPARLARARRVPAAPPATAGASPRQPVAFEAPRELLDYGARDRTLDEIRDFGVTNIRQLVYWRDFAPRPKSKPKPRGGFDAAD